MYLIRDFDESSLPRHGLLLEWHEAEGAGTGVEGFGLKDSRTSNFLLGWKTGLLEPSASGVVLDASSVMCIASGQGWIFQKRLLFAKDF